MDQTDASHNLTSAGTVGATSGGSSSLELGKVKKVLSVKMEKPEIHYTSVVPLGKGSFGEVHSAHDSLLGRSVAIKSLKERFRDEEEIVDRFLKEARGTAQLEHPNIIPVHEMGVTDEFGIYFTMKKVQGDNLKEILDQLDAKVSLYQKKYPLSVLLDIFLSVCNAVAFAHSKGVIHRDLKPANIMIGEYGEVLVLDWGLVKQLDMEDGSLGNVQLRMDEFDASDTMVGSVSGTPNYMSPEQADGRIDEVDFLSDIYSLGSILHHILTLRPAFEKTQLRRLLTNVKSGNFDSPRKRRPDLKIPRELEAISQKAMSLHQVSRYRSVEKMAKDIRNYIGHREVSAYKAPRHVRFWKACKRNPVKASVVAAILLVFGATYGAQRAMEYGSFKNRLKNAQAVRAEVDEKLQKAMRQYDLLQELREQTLSKEKTQEEIDAAFEFEKQTDDVETRYSVAMALYSGVPERYRLNAEVRGGLYDIIQNSIDFALYRGRYNLAEQWVAEIERSGVSLHPEALQYLEKVNVQMMGVGRLKITVAENVLEVIVFPYKEYKDLPRFKMDDAIARSKSFPLEIPNIGKGSYLVWVTRLDGTFLPVPVNISHGEERELVLELPRTVPEGMVFVPAGPFIYGGVESLFSRRQTRELPAFFIKKYEVTVGEYLEFWKSLSGSDLQEKYASRIQYAVAERKFHEVWDDDGQLVDSRLSLDFPVVGIPLAAAHAFCEWKSEKLGVTIRLPTADEWEKAARGVDGRRYVWGNSYDAQRNLTLTKNNAVGKEKYPLWAPPGSFPTDASVYNVFDMAGNVREMTSTPFPDSDAFFHVKGGSASTPADFLSCARVSDTPVIPTDIGFRYVQEVPAE